MGGVFFLLRLLLGIFAVLFFFNILRKLYSVALEKSIKESRKTVKLAIDKFLYGKDKEFENGLEEFTRNEPVNKKEYRSLADRYLLSLLERPQLEKKTVERLLTIAKHMEFPSECLNQVKSRNPMIIALGSRRAGLYRVEEAVEDMLAALDILSSENQFEILMGLARIGDGDAMQRAFEIIKNTVIVNERAVIEILSTFPDGKGKEKLFQNILKNNTDYLKVLFLKALNGAMAEHLVGDIREVVKKGNKNIRAAAVKGISSMGGKAPADILIQALGDSDWEVRALAASALAPVNTEEAGLALFRALNDRQWWVRQNAANALTKHSDYEKLFVLAAESGDEYAKDSIISALENGVNPVLLRSIKIMVAA